MIFSYIWHIMKIYHNPQCSKSRGALEVITQRKIEPQIINYLQDPPTKEELTELLGMLGMSALEIIRKNEPVFKEQYEGLTLTNDEWITVLVQHPILIERPIIVHNGKAVIARPVEKVLQLLE